MVVQSKLKSWINQYNLVLISILCCIWHHWGQNFLTKCLFEQPKTSKQRSIQYFGPCKRSKERDTRTDLESMKESGSYQKEYRVTLSWKSNKEMSHSLRNTTYEWTRSVQWATTSLGRPIETSTFQKKSLSTNQKITPLLTNSEGW